MLALVAGFFLVSYLLAPGAIYRLAFSFFIPSKRFQRNRTEEIVFSVLSVLLPFAFTWILTCHTSVGQFPAFHSQPDKREAYRQVLESILSAAPAKTSIVDAYRRSLREQARFILCLWSFCFIEGLITGTTVACYGSYSDKSLRKRFCDHVFLKHVSEWQILFTTITLPAKERSKAVELDVLCGGTLYRGRLVNWFADQDGKLAGVFITDAERFRREDWDRDKDAGKACKRDDYWRKIPGAKLYLAASSVTNYNVRYVETLASSEAQISDVLGIKVTVAAAPTDDETRGPASF